MASAKTTIDVSVYSVAQTKATFLITNLSTYTEGNLVIYTYDESTDEYTEIMSGPTIGLVGQSSISYTMPGLTPNTTYWADFFAPSYGNSDKVSFTTLPVGVVNKEKVLYGPVNTSATRINTMYGSVKGKSRRISKMYGSVDGKARLTYLDVGTIPCPGSVVFYTNGAHTTTDTARILTQADLEALCGGSSSTEITMDGKTFSKVSIKEVTLPEWVGEIPDDFLSSCWYLDTLEMGVNVTSIGANFLTGCSRFNCPLDLTYVESLGDHFLGGCSIFNQPLDISNLTSLPDYFMYSCGAFNQPLDTSHIETFGNSVLRSCTSFNQALDLSSAKNIGVDVFRYMLEFNQPLTIPSTVKSIGVRFMYDCTDMVSPITCNVSASVAESSNNTFGTQDDEADSYTIGTKLAGPYATEWIEKFPTRNTEPYRNTGYASVPIVYFTELDAKSDSQIDVAYGASSWDMNGIYTSGEVELYGDTNEDPATEIDSYNALGLTNYSHTGLTGNTRYYYKVVATNSDGQGTEYITSGVTLPAKLEVSSEDTGYVDYHTFSRKYTITVPASGGEYPQEIAYRIRVGDGEWQDWTELVIHDEATAYTLEQDIVFATGTSAPYTLEFRTTTTAGTATTTVSQAIIPTHTGPQDVEFVLSDDDSDVQTWLSGFSGYSTGTWFVGGQSRPKVTIPQATSGTTTDGASRVSYTAVIASPDNGYSQGIAYDSSEDMSYTFEKESLSSDMPFGAVLARVDAKDSLNAVVQYYEGGMYMSWATPTFESRVERINKLGGIKIALSGAYSGLHLDALNNGGDLNSVKAEYRVLNYAGEPITDWTQIPNSSLQLTQNSSSVLDREYLATTTVVDVEYAKSIIVETRVSDHFYQYESFSVPLSVWDENQVLRPANYEIEIWDWRTNTFVADLSYLVVGDLNITWELNDVEELDFNIGLENFEQKCKEMGVSSKSLLKPYAHDVRVRRNGKYILGCQLVEANIQIPNNSPTLINIKCTGFLNLFKDQYILDEAWSGYTYAQIARKLIYAGQQPDCLIKNPTGDIDTSYWLAANGSVSSSTASHEGSRCIMGTRSGTGWITLGSQMNADSGKPISIDVWVKGQSGVVCQLRERKYITQSSNQVVIADFGLDGNWQHIQVPYTTFFKNGYLIIEMNRTNSSTNLYIDDCYVYAQDDDWALCSMNVNQGVDTASPVQDATRQVDYSLQNIKDAIMDVASMEDDTFDFDFSYDRTFNCYAQKGEEKLGVEIHYPGNVEQMSIGRSAANLANKIYRIGSGIGDERLQVDVMNAPSRRTYGTRESIVTDSNVELESTLKAQAIGDLYDRKDPTNLPTVTIRDGSVNPDVVQVGDYVPVSIQGEDYLDTINDIYRIVKISLTVDTEAVETMKMTFEPPEKRPEKKMVRYIRESLVGNSLNTATHWVEIQALVLVGNEFVNVAQGATVYGSRAFSSDHPGSRVTDGNTSSSTYAGIGSSDTRESITIDLGAEYPVDYVKVWHYYADSRVYYGSRLSVGTELPNNDTSGTQDLETLLWAYTETTGWTETSDGKQSRWLQENNVTEDETKQEMSMIRYIRESHLGNSTNGCTLWSGVTPSLSVDTQVIPGGGQYTKQVYSCRLLSGNAYNATVDSNTGTYVSTSSDENTGRNSVTIDLGTLYPVDSIRLYYYLSSFRTHYGSHLSVGTKLPGSFSGTEDLETVLWADADNSGPVETSAGRKSSSIQALVPKTKVENPRMVRYIKDTSLRNNNDVNKAWHSVNVYVWDEELGTLRDVALGITPTYTASDMENPKYATDGVGTTYSRTTSSGYQSLILDLGKEYPVDYIRVLWHEAGRRIYGCRLSVGTELTEGNEPLETIVWDDGETVGYEERTNGRWSGWIQDENIQKTFTTGNKPIRYIRDVISGNSKNSYNHWVEIEAMVYNTKTQHWDNVALGKTVTGSFTPTEGAFSRVTDGDKTAANYLGVNNSTAGVTVDLGQEYYVDWVRVWHYYDDGRVYTNPVLSVGSSLPENDDGIKALDTVLWNGKTYVETSFGATSQWIQGVE